MGTDPSGSWGFAEADREGRQKCDGLPVKATQSGFGKPSDKPREFEGRALKCRRHHLCFQEVTFSARVKSQM